MGRKKKQPIIKTQNNIEDTSVNTIATDTIATQNIGYQGKVTVSIKRGKTILAKKTYKNQGCYSMFKFIANALAGNFVSNNRPCKIRLFTSTTGTTEADKYDSKLVVSPYILCNAASVGVAVSNPQTGIISPYASITYTFMIPYTLITGKAYRAALYGMNPSDTVNDRCAAFEFDEPVDPSTGSAGNTILEIS